MRNALLLICVAVLSGCGGPQPPPFKPLVDTKLLMQAMVDPAADHIWDSVKTIVTPGHVEEIAPKNTDEWTAVRNAAVVLGESGNLLMVAPRAKDGEEWMQLSVSMVDAAAAAIRAAEARDAEKLFDAGGEIYTACSGCHAKYMQAIGVANRNLDYD